MQWESEKQGIDFQNLTAFSQRRVKVTLNLIAHTFVRVATEREVRELHIFNCKWLIAEAKNAFFIDYFYINLSIKEARLASR